MLPPKDPNSSAVQTLRAARAFNRRTLLKGALGAGAVTLAGPFVVRNALASSGELSLLIWSDELPDPIVPEFTRKTGIKVRTTPFSQTEEMINKLQATDGEGFDLCMPSLSKAPDFHEMEILAPYDTNRLNMGAYMPAMLAGSEKLWTWDGGLHHLPHCWGAEAISWRTDLTTLDYKDLSYGTLWSEPYHGKMQGRPHSLLLGIGLWWDASGKLPSNRMLDTYKDEETAHRIYSAITEFAIKNKSQVKQFWDGADKIKSGFMDNGCVIGQTWDGPPLSLKRQGKPIGFMAPQEGAISWVDGWGMTKNAANIDQVYEFLNFLATPEVAAMVANGSGYNPVIKGADAFLSAETKAAFAAAYPGNALDNLWNRPPDPSWYTQLRNEYAEKFKVA